MKAIFALLVLASACIVDGGKVGDIIRKKATKFKEYQCVEPTDDVVVDYLNFLKCHFPDYVPDAFHKERFARFLKCRKEMINWDPDTAGWSIGLTPLCHFSNAEYDGIINRALEKPNQDDQAVVDEELHRMPAPRGDIWNWVTQGKVTAVKNQGSCGSCYAFGTAAAMETYYAIKYNRLLDFSTQQYVDCTNGYMGNIGCTGGWPSSCFNYNRDRAKHQAWSCYGYTGRNDKCKDSVSCSTLATVTQYYKINNGDEVTMANAVQKYGPIPVCMDFNGLGSYTGGVWDGSCGTVTTHVVTIVGYGTDDATGKPYWLFKNSWGTGWGERGYGRVYRGKNKCAVANYAYYATIA